MSNLTLRTVKDIPLTNQEVDNNFVQLNTDKHENGASPIYQNITATTLSATGPVTGSNLNITNWNTAYSWGNHAAAGYLSSVSLGAYATEVYVNTAVSNLVNSAPVTLDTLNELAAALGDDPNFATTVTTSIGLKWTQDNTKISNWDTAYGWGNHANAGYLTGYTESDPTVPAHVKSITTTEKSNWNTAYSWGDHASAGYLTNSVETDPTVPSHVKLITETQKANWNTAYGWGDHSTEGYLTSFTETDPTVPAHVKSITTTEKSNWNTAYGWGDHSTAGYLTEAVSGALDSLSNVVITSVSTGQVLKYNGTNWVNDTVTSSSVASLNDLTDVSTSTVSDGNALVYDSASGNWQPAEVVYTETDPTVPAHVKSITTTEKSNWNTAYGWGDHSTEGYLQSTNSLSELNNDLWEITTTTPTSGAGKPVGYVWYVV